MCLTHSSEYPAHNALPTVLNALLTALNALFTDNNVSSWKVVGDGDSTVIVLQLKPHLHQQTWRIRTRLKAGASDGIPLARFQETRKDANCERSRQQRQIRQVTE